MTILSLRHLIRVLFFGVSSSTAISQSVRPPAVPLVTHDPYFSIWSMNDRLTDGPTRHWTGRDRRLRGLARIDGQSFRWMGSDPQSLPALKQITLTVTPTRTVYRFEQQGVRLEVSFLSPLLPDDPDVMSRPLTYVTMTARSIDSGFHKIQLLFAAGSELAVDSHTQQVTWSRSRLRQYSITYPSSPFFLLFSPEMLKAQLRLLMEYAQSGRWRFPFAPHDLGTHPKANGQVYGGVERGEENQMPVEESGNMLLMFAALAKVEGNADFANKHWSELQPWAEDLRKEGMDKLYSGSSY